MLIHLRIVFRVKAFLGRAFDDQTNLLFGKFRLREGWIDWIIQNHIHGSNVDVALQKRRDMQGRIERARRLYLDGDLNWQAFTKIKDEAEALLASIYVPEFDDAVEAGQVLNDFGTLWNSASVGSRNRLLRSMLDAIYVDLENREVIGLLPKETFVAPILAMAKRDDVSVLEGKGRVSLGMVETGEGRTPRPEDAPIRICYRLSRYLGLAPAAPYRPGLPPEPADGLWPGLSASAGPHLELCRPAGALEERRRRTSPPLGGEWY